MLLSVDPPLNSIVRPGWFVAEPVHVVARDEAMDEPLRKSAAAMRVAAESAEITAAVRSMYKRVGIDPTKTRPSSEALLRRVRRGDEIPRVNSLVDVINWCSLETQLPYGVYDLDKIQGDVTLRLGNAGEEYPGIRKDAVHVFGRLTLADDAGAFGNPTSDSARTMITTDTTRALVVIFCPTSVSAAVCDAAVELTKSRTVSR
jgi:DNA/RNA-binding domain of Phe-tRNA-synthetase-like protein